MCNRYRVREVWGGGAVVPASPSRPTELMRLQRAANAAGVEKRRRGCVATAVVEALGNDGASIRPSGCGAEVSGARGGLGTGTCNDSQGGDEHEGDVDVGESLGGRPRRDGLVGCEEWTAERPSASSSERSHAEGPRASVGHDDDDEWDGAEGTEEAYTLQCEAAAQRALEGLDRADRAGAAAPEGSERSRRSSATRRTEEDCPDALHGDSPDASSWSAVVLPTAASGSAESAPSGRTPGALARLAASRGVRRAAARKSAASTSALRLLTERAASRPARAAAAQQAATARTAAGGPPLVVGPASVDRVMANRDVAGAEDRPLLRRRLGDRSSAGDVAADASTRLLQILSGTASALNGGTHTAEAIERSLGNMGDSAGRVAVTATVRRLYPQYIWWMSTFYTTMTQLLGDGVLPNLRGPIDVQPSKPIHGGVLAIWVEMVACDLVPRRGMAANGDARGGAPHSKVDGLGDKAYTYNYVRCLLDGTSGWSRAHGLVAPQQDPRWAETVSRARRLAKRMLDTGRSFRAEAFSPLCQVRWPPGGAVSVSCGCLG